MKPDALYSLIGRIETLDKVIDSYRYDRREEMGVDEKEHEQLRMAGYLVEVVLFLVRGLSDETMTPPE